MNADGAPWIAGRPKRGGRFCRCLALWLGVFCRAAPSGLHAEPLSESFRIGFSSSMFSDVNENDAKAAVKVWGELIAREHPASCLDKALELIAAHERLVR